MRSALLVLLLSFGVTCAYSAVEIGKGLRGDRDIDIRRDNDRLRDDDIRDDNGSRDYIDRDENIRDDSGSRDYIDRDEGIRDRDRDGNWTRDLYYPCDFEDDMECIRHFFASTGQCKEAHNYGNKPVYRDRLVAYLPGYNLTVVYTKSRIKYIGDRISRFYINKKTDNLVMAVDFEGINVESRYATFIYQRRGQEPYKRTDSTNGTFPVALTAVIPLKKGIDFKEARVTTYLASLPQNVQVGPRILTSTEPVAVQVNAAIFANLQMATLENFLTEGPSVFFGYLQKYICDFGIPISS